MKNKAKRKADRTGDPTDSRVSFFRMKNYLKDAVRQAKVNYLESLVSKSRRVPGCAAEVWSYVNAMFGHTKSYQSPQQDLGSLNSINDYFQTVAISSDHRCANDFVVPADSSVGADPFVFSEISVSSVLSHLQSLDPKKSTGPDGLSARFLKKIAVEIASPLTQLCNISLLTGAFPSDWKHSHITPVHKGGPFDDPSNFRPISVVLCWPKFWKRLFLSSSAPT